MRSKQRSIVLCAALMGLWIAGSATAENKVKVVKLWPHQSHTFKFRDKIEEGSETVKNTKPVMTNFRITPSLRIQDIAR